MSAEVRESVYFKCDNVSFGGFGCQNRFGYDDRAPADANGLQALAATARSKGWQVEVYGQGLKGYTANAFCPEHRRPIEAPQV